VTLKYGPELGRAAVALFLAVALWLVVSAEETTAAWVPVHIALTLDPSVSLVDDIPDVRAFVVGRRRDLFKLISSPPTIQRAVTDDDRDSVRIELRAADLDLPVGADITVRDLLPRLLTFRLQHVRNEEPPHDLLLKSRPADTTPPIQPDSVLDSLTRAKLILDSTATVIPVRDSLQHDSLARDKAARGIPHRDTLRHHPS
jgi:hypothetical protein